VLGWIKCGVHTDRVLHPTVSYHAGGRNGWRTEVRSSRYHAKPFNRNMFIYLHLSGLFMFIDYVASKPRMMMN